MMTAGVVKRFQHALTQHRFDFVSTCFNTVEKVGGGTKGFHIIVQQNRTDGKINNVETICPGFKLNIFIEIPRDLEISFLFSFQTGGFSRHC